LRKRDPCRSLPAFADRRIDGEKPMVWPLWREPRPLVLASTSAIRLALLRAAGIPTEAVPSNVDEADLRDSNAVDAAAVATRLARAKAVAVSRVTGNRLVLGADQTLSANGQIFTKAANRHAAARQLMQLSGQPHQLHSAITIARDGELLGEAIEHASMRMRVLSSTFIDDYLTVAGEAVLNSVGCYQLEGLGIHLFEEVNGNFSTILGLPLLAVLRWLRQLRCVAE
jgi:septum formation protein